MLQTFTGELLDGEDVVELVVVLVVVVVADVPLVEAGTVDPLVVDCVAD